MKIEPLKMIPFFVPKVWGGRRLAERFGKVLPDERPYGESWEVADLPEGQSRVIGGAWDGKTLGEVRAAMGVALIGTDAPGDRFPLLVKLLDACDDLSVQVHPGEDDLHRFEGARSKDEAWIILDSDDGSLLLGFREGTDAHAFKEAVLAGHAESVLQRIPVEHGDVFRLAPGTVHAICRGTALLEVQEPSDTTFRVYDYNRPGFDGKPRELHLEDALSVAHVEPYSGEGVRGRLAESGRPDDHVTLVEASAYRIEELCVRGGTSWPISPTSPQVVHVVNGRASFNGVELDTFETVVLPAALGGVEVTGDASLVVCGLGGTTLIA